MNVRISTKYLSDAEGNFQWFAFVDNKKVCLKASGKTEQEALRKLNKMVCNFYKFIPSAREALGIKLGIITDVYREEE